MITAIVVAIAAALGVASARGRDAFDRLFADWKRLLRKYIREPGEREAVTALLEQQRRNVDELFAIAEQDLLELARVHREYGSTRADYVAIVERLGADILAGQVAMLDTSVEIQAALGDATAAKILAELDRLARKRSAKLDKQAAREAEGPAEPEAQP